MNQIPLLPLKPVPSGSTTATWMQYLNQGYGYVCNVTPASPSSASSEVPNVSPGSMLQASSSVMPPWVPTFSNGWAQYVSYSPPNPSVSVYGCTNNLQQPISTGSKQEGGSGSTQPRMFCVDMTSATAGSLRGVYTLYPGIQFSVLDQCPCESQTASSSTMPTQSQPSSGSASTLGFGLGSGAPCQYPKNDYQWKNSNVDVTNCEVNNKDVFGGLRNTTNTLPENHSSQPTHGSFVAPPPMPVLPNLNSQASSQQQCCNETAMEESTVSTQEAGNNVKAPMRYPIIPHLCSFCRNNGETREFYTSHTLRDANNLLTCPVLRNYVCPICSATGANAHTISRCPKNETSKGWSYSQQLQGQNGRPARNSRGIIGSYKRKYRMLLDEANIIKR